MLAFLLLREGHPAAAEEIIESLWGEDAPRSVNGVLRTYVHRLRRLFPTGPHANPLIQSIAGSYLLPAPCWSACTSDCCRGARRTWSGQSRYLPRRSSSATGMTCW